MTKQSKNKSSFSQYEIMLVVDGTLPVEKARQSISNLLELFSNKPNYDETVIVNSALAYVINGKTICHRFVLNFELEDPSILKEFNRLSLLNKDLLRHLVINKSKDKGWRALNNPKKVKDFEIRQEKKKQYLEIKKQQAMGS